MKVLKRPNYDVHKVKRYPTYLKNLTAENDALIKVSCRIKLDGNLVSIKRSKSILNSGDYVISAGWRVAGVNKSLLTLT